MSEEAARGKLGLTSNLAAFLRAFYDYLASGGVVYVVPPADPAIADWLVASFLATCAAEATRLAESAALDDALTAFAYVHEQQMIAGTPDATELAIVREHLARCTDTVQFLRGQADVTARRLAQLERRLKGMR